MVPGDYQALREFFNYVPDDERHFLKDDVVSEAVIKRWCGQPEIRPCATASRAGRRSHGGLPARGTWCCASATSAGGGLSALLSPGAVTLHATPAGLCWKAVLTTICVKASRVCAGAETRNQVLRQHPTRHENAKSASRRTTDNVRVFLEALRDSCDTQSELIVRSDMSLYLSHGPNDRACDGATMFNWVYVGFQRSTVRASPAEIVEHGAAKTLTRRGESSQ